MAAIFFMTSFNRDRGGMAPLAPPPPGSAAEMYTSLLLVIGSVKEVNYT